ncbi:hypothetical protein [Nocardia sp. NPDC050710]|uniref:hypothetical protein n=1 Tax=Nocardia sp. NPDC050710 TaxID=3157220 RepID=UPI0033D22788
MEPDLRTLPDAPPQDPRRWIALWYGIGLLTLMCLGFLTLPRDAKLEPHEIDVDELDPELARV